MTESSEQDRRLVLITGATRGLGRAAAEAFAATGAHLILVARTVGGLEETDDAVQAAGGTATLVPIDLTDFDQIDRMAQLVYERWGRLDVLVGNAGRVGALSPVSHLKPKDWSATFDLNLTANYRLIRAFEPLLKQSPAGRAVFVSSAAARSMKAYWGGYGASKAALEALVGIWAAELAKSPVRVNLLDPGPFQGGTRAAAFPGENPATLPAADAIAPLVLELADPACTRHGEILRAPRPDTA